MSEVPLLHTLLPYKHTLRASDIISEESMATMQLFNGETTYGTKERKKVLTSILRVVMENCIHTVILRPCVKSCYVNLASSDALILLQPRSRNYLRTIR